MRLLCEIVILSNSSYTKELRKKKTGNKLPAAQSREGKAIGQTNPQQSEDSFLGPTETTPEGATVQDPYRYHFPPNQYPLYEQPQILPNTTEYQQLPEPSITEKPTKPRLTSPITIQTATSL